MAVFDNSDVGGHAAEEEIGIDNDADGNSKAESIAIAESRVELSIVSFFIRFFGC